MGVISEENAAVEETAVGKTAPSFRLPELSSLVKKKNKPNKSAVKQQQPRASSNAVGSENGTALSNLNHADRNEWNGDAEEMELRCPRVEFTISTPV